MCHLFSLLAHGVVRVTSIFAYRVNSVGKGGAFTLDGQVGQVSPAVAPAMVSPVNTDSDLV